MSTRAGRISACECRCLASPRPRPSPRVPAPAKRAVTPRAPPVPHPARVAPARSTVFKTAATVAHRQVSMPRCSPASRVPSLCSAAIAALDPACAPRRGRLMGDGQRAGSEQRALAARPLRAYSKQCCSTAARPRSNTAVWQARQQHSHVAAPQLPSGSGSAAERAAALESDAR